MATPTARRTSEAAHNDLYAHYSKSQMARLKATKTRLKREILPRLRSLGVAQVYADYSGHAGSGAVDFVDCSDDSDQSIDVGNTTPDLMHDLRGAICELLPEGFEEGEGGQGDFYIDVAEGTVTIEHGANYTETKRTNQEFTL